MSQMANQEILKEAQAAGLWFHAKKTRPIWVRVLDREDEVQTLEGKERVSAGNYLCRGEAGELWPQSPERLVAKYNLTEEMDEQGWRRCEPKPNSSGVMAAQLPHAFQVHSKWGVLCGKAGDFLLKSYEDLHNANPLDVWIVDQQLFHATYEQQRLTR